MNGLERKALASSPQFVVVTCPDHDVEWKEHFRVVSAPKLSGAIRAIILAGGCLIHRVQTEDSETLFHRCRKWGQVIHRKRTDHSETPPHQPSLFKFVRA
jgi:hypothetical protein